MPAPDRAKHRAPRTLCAKTRANLDVGFDGNALADPLNPGGDLLLRESQVSSQRLSVGAGRGQVEAEQHRVIVPESLQPLGERTHARLGLLYLSDGLGHVPLVCLLLVGVVPRQGLGGDLDLHLFLQQPLRLQNLPFHFFLRA